MKILSCIEHTKNLQKETKMNCSIDVEVWSTPEVTIDYKVYISGKNYTFGRGKTPSEACERALEEWREKEERL